MNITLFNQEIRLLPQRAAYWQEQNLLIIADIHLGKAAHFQKAGIPVPEGAMEEDLRQLKNLIEKTKAEQCVVVGDLIHAKPGLTPPIINRFSQWLHELPCEIHLVLGNHDRALKKHLPPSWKLHIHAHLLTLPPFAFTHLPQQIPHFFVWSGHLHPQILLKSGPDQLRLRCFQIYADVGILPAFSSFVGGTYVKRQDSHIYAIGDTQVFEI